MFFFYLRKRKAYYKLRPLLKFKLYLKTKLLIYETIITSIWSYGVQIWGPAKPSDIRPILTLQNNGLQLITGTAWYIRNASLNKDLNITTIKELVVKVLYKIPFQTRHPRKLPYKKYVHSRPTLKTRKTPKRKLTGPVTYNN